MNRAPVLDTDHRCPPEHGHGVSHTCYNSHKCRCPECRARVNTAARRRFKLRAYGRWQPTRVPAVGTQRRVKALIAIGWSQQKIAIGCGMLPAAVWRLLDQNRALVERVTAERVADLYEQLWNQRPIVTTSRQMQGFHRVTNYAAARGWLPPLAWDDIDTDPEPPAVEPGEFVDEILVQNVCNGQPGRLNRLERIEAIRILNARYLSDAEIATALGVADRTVWRIRQAEHIAAALGADGMPIAS